MTTPTVEAYIAALEAEQLARNTYSGDHAADCALRNETHRRRIAAQEAVRIEEGRPEPRITPNTIPGWPGLPNS